VIIAFRDPIVAAGLSSSFQDGSGSDTVPGAGFSLLISIGLPAGFTSKALFSIQELGSDIMDDWTLVRLEADSDLV